MTKVTGQTLGGGLITLDQRINRRFFNQALQSVAKKRLSYARKQLKTLPSLSSMYEAADAWKQLTSGEKSSWADAGLECGLSAYNLFIQDKVYRIINSIAGNATPSDAHQYLVGHLYLPNSAGHFLLRMVGTSTFTFPASLHIHFKTILTDENPSNGYLKIRFKYKYDAGGGELEQTNEISLSLNSDWTSQNTTITEKTAQTEHWELEIEGNYLHGDFWFDNFYVSSAEGYVNFDSNCERVSKYFNFLIQPNNSIIESIYPAD